MTRAAHYGVEPGQVYAPLDGSAARVVVKDVETFSDVDDVVVYKENSDEERRINVYRLARLKYYLVDFNTGDDRKTLLKALREGTARADQQVRIASLLQAMQHAMAEQQEDVRRGRFMVEQGEWRTREDDRDGHRTWLCVRVADHADLSCQGTRARELDKAIAASVK